MEGSLVAYKVFTNGSVLNASEINDNLMNQSVMVFSNSTARAAALTSPVEGMLTWLQDTNKYENYNGTAWVALGGGAILQLVSVSKTDTFSMSSTTYADITGLTATITPTSATSKILVQVVMSANANQDATTALFKLFRGSTEIGLGDAAGSRLRSAFPRIGTSSANNINVVADFLDSPATTSATTYKVQMRTEVGGNSVFINRSNSDGDSAVASRSISSITLTEVAV
jgi:hypothetical protein